MGRALLHLHVRTAAHARPRVQAQPGQARTRREQHPLLLSCFRVSLLTLSCFASTSLQSPVTAPRSQNPARDGGPHSGLALCRVRAVLLTWGKGAHKRRACYEGGMYAINGTIHVLGGNAPPYRLLCLVGTVTKQAS